MIAQHIITYQRVSKMQLTIFPLLSGLFVLFNHCAHVNALPKQVDASSFANLAPGYAQHGNYLLYGCDQTFNAEGLLDQTYNFLKTAISSASPSNPVYAAMFRDVPPAQVQAVLSNIIAGTPLSVASTAGGSAIPTIVCVNNQDPKLTSAWNYCQSEATGSFGVYSMHAVGTQYVYLCPRVNMLFLTPDNAFCGQIIDGGKTLTTPFNVAITKYTNLVHELVHLYVQDPPGLQPEVYLVNDCMALPPDQKVQNAQNYAFYVGCMLFSLILLLHCCPH